MTQQEICEQLLPTIQQSPVYEKFGTFRYRIPGEQIETWIDGKLETTQFAPCTTKVAMIGPKNEEYLVDIFEFGKKYNIVEVADWNGKFFGTVKPKGKINAIQVSPDNFVQSFVAAWNEQMNVTTGGFYACPVGGNEVYFIDEEVFYQTYKQI